MLALILFLLGAPNAKADPVNVTCTTEPLTTSLVVFTKGADVTVRVIHHNGTDHMPLSTRNVTPSDLSRLTQKANDLKQLGSQYDIHLDSSHCALSAQKLIDCHGAIDETVEGHRLTWLSLDSSKITAVSPLYPLAVNQISMNLAFTMDGKDYDFAAGFDARNCVDTSPR
ncbi:MAG: hypothetical protein ACXVB9_16355 [Bdellovibrionota bacterium]